LGGCNFPRPSYLESIGLPVGTSKALIDAAIDASGAGEQAVTDAVALVITGVLQSDLGEEQS
jgi:hypothetical protein